MLERPYGHRKALYNTVGLWDGAHVCEVCGEYFFPNGGRSRKESRTCSRECGAKIRKAPKADPAKQRIPKPKREVICVICGEGFLSSPGGPGRPAKYCSKDCRNVVQKLAARVYTKPTDKICPECGTTFTVAVGDPGSSRIYCTDRCSNRASSRNNRHNARCAKNAKKRRALRIKEQTVLMTDEPTITLLRLANRDGWVCWLCGKVVTKDDWSIDHVIQLSDGGAHAWFNIHLAHHRCNSRRAVDHPETLYY